MGILGLFVSPTIYSAFDWNNGTISWIHQYWWLLISRWENYKIYGHHLCHMHLGWFRNNWSSRNGAVAKHTWQRMLDTIHSWRACTAGQIATSRDHSFQVDQGNRRKRQDSLKRLSQVQRTLKPHIRVFQDVTQFHAWLVWWIWTIPVMALWAGQWVMLSTDNHVMELLSLAYYMYNHNTVGVCFFQPAPPPPRQRIIYDII